MLAQTSRFIAEIVSTDLAIIAVHSLENTTQVAVTDIRRTWIAIVTDDIYRLADIVRTCIRSTRVIVFTLSIVTR